MTVTHTSRAEALFASSLQPSMFPTTEEINAAIETSLRVHGGEDGCAAVMAAEYGEHPQVAPHRMRWALSLVVAGG